MSAAPASSLPFLPSRIAVFRTSRPSGLLRSVPALRALREAFPGASITLVSTEKARGFVRRFHHYLDDLLVFPGLPDEPDDPGLESALPRFYAEASARRFDIAIQLQDSAQAWNHIVAKLGAAHWAGFVPEDASADTFADPAPGASAILVPWPRHLPEVLRYTALIQHLGIVVNSTELELPLSDSDHEQAERILQASGLNPHQTVVLHPGALTPSAGWPVERYARLAQELVAHGWQIAITGPEHDRPTTQALRAAMRCFSMDLTGVLSPGAFGAILAKCRLLVCNQTSISHVAAAVQTPSIVVASGHDMNRWILPNNELHTVLWQPAGMTPQGRPDWPHGHGSYSQACDVDTERVLLHARYKLGMGGTLA